MIIEKLTFQEDNETLQTRKILTGLLDIYWLILNIHFTPIFFGMIRSGHVFDVMMHIELIYFTLYFYLFFWTFHLTKLT